MMELCAVDDRGKNQEQMSDELHDLRQRIAELEVFEARYKVAEETLRNSEQKYRLLFQHSPVGVFHYDTALRITDCNDRLVGIFKSDRTRLVGQNLETSKDTSLLPALRKALAGEEGFYQGFYRSTTGAAEIWIFLHTAPFFDQKGKIMGGIGILENISPQKEAYDALNEAEERYRSIVENTVEGVFQTAPEGKFLMANSALARMFGYDSPEELKQSVYDTQKQLYVNPAERTKLLSLLEERGAVDGFETQLYRKDGSTIWCSINARALYDIHGKLLYYEGTTENITARKQAEQALQETMQKLRTTLGGMIQAIAMTVETKDPYTAGHQRRVADLARAIAQEMKLPVEKVDGIRIAGVIHDLGKISVPAEILSKPTKLTDIEYGLIKIHPQAGYDILKEVEFPWPIAQIVLQHHERLDGSGYPQGLRGEEILLESRILVVADVVEAMASHRPYRPGLGLDKALEEISSNRGVLYDPAVVDACLRIFTEKGFELKY